MSALSAECCNSSAARRVEALGSLHLLRDMTAPSSDPLSLGREGAGMVLVQVLGSDKHPLVRKVHMI
jgi:hypothetical protein